MELVSILCFNRYQSTNLISCNSMLRIIIILYTLLMFSIADYAVDLMEKTPTGYRIKYHCDATGADFGSEVPPRSYAYNSTGCASFTEPANACSAVTFRGDNATDCLQFFAIVPRGTCNFSEKAYYVQLSFPELYQALIIYTDHGPPVKMMGTKYADDIKIPVLMVDSVCVRNMIHFPAKDGYILTMYSIPGYTDLLKYLVPFVAVVGFCFITLFISLGIRLFRERRRLARKRLSKRALKKIPTKKFKKGRDNPDTCPICLEEFADDERLRILLCNHIYHCKCVDPWLTKTRKVCPVCKRKVCPSGESDSSDSEVERNRDTTTSDNNSMTTRENAPLLRNQQLMGTSQDISQSSGRAFASAASMTLFPATSTPNQSSIFMGEHPEIHSEGTWPFLHELPAPFRLRILSNLRRLFINRSDSSFLDDSNTVPIFHSGNSGSFAAENVAFDIDSEISTILNPTASNANAAMISENVLVNPITNFNGEVKNAENSS